MRPICGTLGLLLVGVLCAYAAEAPSRSRPRALLESWRRGLPASDATTVPRVVTRDARLESVSVKEAIAIALEHNPRIAARRLEPLRQDQGILTAQGKFDPSLNAELTWSTTATPNANVLGGTATSVVDDRIMDFHLLKQTRLGTMLQLDFTDERLDNNSAFNQLRPQYKPAFNLSVVQPLLRDFGWDFSYLVVRVAERAADAAAYQYEADVADFVELVIEAYWNVVRARENLEVRREAKALADRTVEENDARVRVGLLPPVASLEAQADAKSREEQVIIAENGLAIARQNLAQLAHYRPDGAFVPRTLEPVEDVTPEAVHVDLDETLATALEERPEVHASASSVQAQQLNEKIASNALLPRLDVVGNYGRNALSGTQSNVSNLDNGATIRVFDCSAPAVIRLGNACTPLPEPADPAQGRKCLCQVPPLPTLPSPFVGDKATAYDRLSNVDNSYSFGVQLQVPLSNATARGQYAQTRIARDQAELNHRELLSKVTLEVQQSVSDVVASRQRIDTTRVATQLAEENLRNQQKRHEVGMATTKDLLDFQTRLTTARAAEVQAKTDYAIAVAQWRRAHGRLLAHYQIIVEHPGERSVPWFARF